MQATTRQENRRGKNSRHLTTAIVLLYKTPTNNDTKMGAEIFWELIFRYFGNYFFSMVSIGGGHVSGGGGLSLQRR